MLRAPEPPYSGEEAVGPALLPPVGSRPAGPRAAWVSESLASGSWSHWASGTGGVGSSPSLGPQLLNCLLGLFVFVFALWVTGVKSKGTYLQACLEWP